MKKIRKKMLLALIMALIITLTLTALPATAISGISLDDIDYYSDDIPAKKLNLIVNAMYGISNDEITPRSSNPLCWIGLHSKQTGTVVTTEHRISATNPRCRQTRTFVEYCTRDSCSYYVITGETSGSIVCCPVN